ncbi:hypothetical protein MJO28_004988 [Puccinia striiformis f. sp. tritici]|uniref:Uncharacterized protein n=1 Tax=Puccinia striiformis f. sp. tritici TaxID=168172 RepID=A0ACC0EIZ8_9BASI|nr:hypothetical protein MJO28_004988 [Puccinia striiformis f. sp. tritici]
MVNDGSKNLPKIGLRSNQTTCKSFLNELITLAGTGSPTALVDQRQCTSVSHSLSRLEGSPKPPRSRFEQGAFEAPQDLPSGGRRAPCKRETPSSRLDERLEGVSMRPWCMLDMHGDNPAATAHGQGDIKDNMDSLYHDSMSDGSDDESIGYLLGDLGPVNTSADADIPQTLVPRQSRRRRHPDDGLTAEELALDPQASPPPGSNPSCRQSGGISGEVGGYTDPFRVMDPPSPTSMAFGSILPADPADTATQGTTEVGQTEVLPSPAPPATPAPLSSTAPGRPMSRPPAVPAASRIIPRRRGRTEESPKKEDSTGSAMLMMMHKSTEQANLWMIEERQRAEQNRADDRREAEAKAAEKAQFREEQRRLAKEEREDALELHCQDRKEAQTRAALAEAVRKEERQDALEARRLEAV